MQQPQSGFVLKRRMSAVVIVSLYHDVLGTRRYWSYLLVPVAAARECRADKRPAARPIGEPSS